MTNQVISCDEYFEELKSLKNLKVILDIFILKMIFFLDHDSIRIIKMDPYWFITLNSFKTISESNYAQT